MAMIEMCNTTNDGSLNNVSLLLFLWPLASGPHVDITAICML